jgi:hypothetical protein
VPVSRSTPQESRTRLNGAVRYALRARLRFEKRPIIIALWSHSDALVTCLVK